jgi:hypothetical protein
MCGRSFLYFHSYAAIQNYYASTNKKLNAVLNPTQICNEKYFAVVGGGKYIKQN